MVVNEVEDLQSCQEETDTRIVLYLNHTASLGFKSALVRSPDTDVFMILLHHAANVDMTIYIDIGVKRRQILNVSQIAQTYGAEYCTALLGLYVFTGEDVTSAFKGKGKVRPLKKLQSFPKFQPYFR